MHHRFQRTNLAPDGFSVDSIHITVGSVQILLSSRSRSGHCPDCRYPSRRIQSQFMTRPADLPISVRCEELVIKTRRF